jgi:hypothetical protein
MKRLIRLTFAILLVFTISIPVYAKSDNSFNSWTENNIYSGEDELTNMSKKLDRANLAYILVEALDLESTTNQTDISDVNRKDWCYSYIQTAINHKIFTLNNNKEFKPNDYVSREELIKIISFLPIKYAKFDESKNTYKDLKDVDTQYVSYIKNFIASGFMSNISNEYILPKRIATISDTIDILNKIFPNINAGTTKSQVYDGNFLIKDKMTYIENITINGDLFITQGAIEKFKTKDNFKISLKNVNVKGNIYIYGGSNCGEYVFNKIKANKLIINTTDSVIFNIDNCKILEIEDHSKQSNFITNMKLNFVKSAL